MQILRTERSMNEVEAANSIELIHRCVWEIQEDKIDDIMISSVQKEPLNEQKYNESYIEGIPKLEWKF